VQLHLVYIDPMAAPSISTASIIPQTANFDQTFIEVMANTPSSILHRTTWRPPVAIRAEGIYVDLEDGRRVIDAVGGAAVVCIGNSHPVVKDAIRTQLDQVSCMCSLSSAD
jgi:Adenosylmethionine-8-amino-7-oxononanoate aminotransferase